ncbi:hypothetical protein PHMEG_00037640, partial [Phytophthora megakarya]
MLDAVDEAWRDYNIDRVKRNDRLRTKYPYICWKGSLEAPPPVDGMISEFLFEPTMPLYGMEYLTWIPKTPMWLKEVAELDAREPWRNYWLDCPEKHPYNTTFYPCNPDRPLFVPVGHSLGSVGPLIVRDPALTNAEIVGGWEQTFQEILEIKAMLDAVDEAWRDYNIDRVKLDGMISEFLFEPTIPLYGMKYLPWIPKTPMWLKEVAELDAREPWRNYWLDCPEKHPYNTTFYPCNPDRPLFVPVGHSLGSVGPLIVRDPALTNAEIVGGWEQTFQGSPPVVESLIDYDPTPEELVEPADPPELLLLNRLMALAKDTVFPKSQKEQASASREGSDEVAEGEESEQEEVE